MTYSVKDVSQRMKTAHIFHWIILSIITFAVIFLLILPIARLGKKIEIDYNEGSNVYRSLKAISGQLIYDKKNEWAPINYPPISFYIVGSIGNLLNDPLLAGRLVSLVSLFLVSFCVAYSVRKLGGEVYDAVFAGIICVGFIAANATDYVGMNDPQMLGHVVIVSGLLVYLQNPLGNRNIFITALLFSVGLFIKHSLIPLPLSVGTDLFIRSHRRFLKWLAYFAAFLLSLIIGTLLIAGSDFLNQLTMPREYSTQKLFSDSLRYVCRMSIPLITILPWLFYAIKKENIRVISIYILFSLAWGIFIQGGSGIDVNSFFDSIISISIAAGMLLVYLRTNFQNLSKPLNLGYPIIPIIFGIVIFAAVTIKTVRNGEAFDFRSGVWNKATNSELKIREKIFLEDAAFLANQPGTVICENLLMCYFAKKPREYDTHATREMIVTGKIKEKKILSRLEKGYFTVVQLNEQLPERYLQDSTNTSVQKEHYNERFTENFKYALGKHYILVRKTINSAFYIPKNKA